MILVLTARGRARLAGIARVDSVALDPHKGLFLPNGTGVLLVRDAATLRHAYAADGHYLQDVRGAGDLPDYADLGPELTRDYRGLRIWLPLHLHGVAAFREPLDEKLDLASFAYEELAGEPSLGAALAPGPVHGGVPPARRSRRWRHRARQPRAAFTCQRHTANPHLQHPHR
jgi:aromatic-L-amino-acid decarboxylase